MKLANKEIIKNKVNVFHQVAQGLSLIHSKNVVYGDIKLNNILVRDTKDGQEADLADFGGSKHKSELAIRVKEFLTAQHVLICLRV